MGGEGFKEVFVQGGAVGCAYELFPGISSVKISCVVGVEDGRTLRLRCGEVRTLP